MKTTDTTDELLKQLNSAHSEEELSEWLEDKLGEKGLPEFSQYLKEILQEKGLSRSSLIQRAGIHRTYGYQILSGERRPGRDKVLAICLAAGLSYEESQRTLAVAGEGRLYPRDRRDAILIFAISRGLDVIRANELLYEMGEAVLE